MKKNLLSILAGALVLVGCQNYDDQFDSLESQIKALASTAAGLSQLQSDLTNLSSTVAALQGSLDSSDAALADGLASINDVIAELQSQVDNINEILEGVELDIDDLLASNNVFTGDLIINSSATLEFAESLSDRVKFIVSSTIKFTNTTLLKTEMKHLDKQVMCEWFIEGTTIVYTSEKEKCKEKAKRLEHL
ncbi:MAG: hypothetical protein ACO2Z3_02190 [Flavobacteriaceae bacterium]